MSGFTFLNHDCLTRAGMNTVKDLRVQLLRRVQEQSMQFHGRIDVGQLMSRATGDPHQVQQIIQQYAANGVYRRLCDMQRTS